MLNRLLILFLLLFFQHASYADTTRTIKVGVFNNTPIVFQNENKTPSGLAIDLLENIAEREEWKLEYVHGSWAEVLKKLDNAEIDLLVGIAYSDKRALLYNYTEQAIISNWGSIYRRKDTAITSMLDLEGKRIAMMGKSIHSRVFQSLLTKFNINYTPVIVDNYHDVMKIVEAGNADAGVINRVFSIVNSDKYNLVATPIMFNPVEVRYAAPKSNSKIVLTTIDRHLKEQKENPNSHYHQALKRWLDRTPSNVFPTWLIWLLTITIIALIGFILLNSYLRRIVIARTKDLHFQRELAQSDHEKLNNVIERVNDGFVSLDKNWYYTYVNTRAANMLQRNNPADLIGKHIWTEFPEGIDEPFYKAYFKAMETQLPITLEQHFEPWDQWYENRIYPSDDGLTIYFTDITDRKKALQSLTTSEEKYRTLFDNANDAIYLIETETQQILDCNKRASSMLGYTSEEFKKMKVTDLVDENQHHIIQPILEKLKTKSNVDDIICSYHKTKSGISIPVEVTVSKIELDDRILHISIVRDVSEHQKAELELRESEQFNRMLFEMTPIGLALTTMDGELKDINPAYANIIGRSIEETKQLSYWEITPEKYKEKEQEQEQLNSLENTGFYGPYEKEYIHKDGSLVDVKLSGMIIKRNDQSFIWSTVEDISARKLADNQLNRVNRALKVLSNCNEALIRATDESELLNNICKIIVDLGQYPCVWIGQTEHLKTVTPICQYGFTDNFLEKLNLSERISIEKNTALSKAIYQNEITVVRDIKNNLINTNQTNTEENLELSTYITLPINVESHIYGVLTIYASSFDAFDDEEKRLLKELVNDISFGITGLRANKEKQQLQRQLQQSQKMDAIGQLTGGIAHDFNNILASIIGYTDLAISVIANKPEDKILKYLKEVSKAGDRARNLVAQMLAFSRGIVTHPVQVEIVPLVTEVINLLKSTLPSSVEINIISDDNVPPIMMDAVHLHQVVMNLCINARDALEGEGLIELTIKSVKNIKTECSSCFEDVEGDFVELSVRDTGSGIDADAIERIFDPFFTTKEIGKGTGMGLSMVHGIVHEHSGHILLESNPQSGSNFRLLFPAATSLDFSNITTIPAHQDIVTTTQSAKIIVVDDDDSVAVYISELLKMSGYQVTTLTDSESALELFIQHPNLYDLVLSDQTMPGITGTELAKSILQLRPDIPIILCTGYSEIVDDEKAREMGIKKFLLKPLNSQILLHTVAELLQKN